MAVCGTPFGEANRGRLIAQYLANHGTLSAATAWKAVYGLLLWIDRTTGLAHCYESDKCQPGRHWYGRALSFHAWLSDAFGVSPLVLSTQVDWLFRHALLDYTSQVAGERERRSKVAERQRSRFGGLAFPNPGSDLEIERIVAEALATHLKDPVPREVFEAISDRLREYWKIENKRKNLLGEGFEDVLGSVLGRVLGKRVHVRTRVGIGEIGGYSAPGRTDKETKVDLVIESARWARPVLVNVKWSIRADREDQLWDDFSEYVRLDRDHRGFDHYLLTNEFDPARLYAAHLCPDLIHR
jgi:hypothetical protein